jgi:hypothetical protein
MVATATGNGPDPIHRVDLARIGVDMPSFDQSADAEEYRKEPEQADPARGHDRQPLAGEQADDHQHDEPQVLTGYHVPAPERSGARSREQRDDQDEIVDVRADEYHDGCEQCRSEMRHPADGRSPAAC